MKIRKKLKVKLFADEDLVVESDDPKLWGQVLNFITGASAELPQAPGQITMNIDLPKAIKEFAQEIGVTPEVLQGACSPSKGEPYLHLNAHYWEAFQKNHSVLGRAAIAPLQVAGTLLALWFECAKMGKLSSVQALAVLETLNLRDQNYARTLNRCSWLQHRNKEILINPAEMSRAVAVARAYCTKQPLEKE
jgi:hypothetical protein